MNASPSAAATFSCWASTSFGLCFAIKASNSGRSLSRSHRFREPPPDRAAAQRDHVVPQLGLIEQLTRHRLIREERVVVPAEHRVELDRMQIHDLARVPSILQTAGELLKNRVAERPRVRMGIHRQDLHHPHQPLSENAFAHLLTSRSKHHFTRWSEPSGSAPIHLAANYGTGAVTGECRRISVLSRRSRNQISSRTGDQLIGISRSTSGSIRSRISARLSPVTVIPWLRRPITAWPGSGSRASSSATLRASSSVPHG